MAPPKTTQLSMPATRPITKQITRSRPPKSRATKQRGQGSVQTDDDSDDDSSLLDQSLMEVLERLFDVIKKAPAKKPHEIVRWLASQQVTTWQNFLMLEDTDFERGLVPISAISVRMLGHLKRMIDEKMVNDVDGFNNPDTYTKEDYENYVFQVQRNRRLSAPQPHAYATWSASVFHQATWKVMDEEEQPAFTAELTDHCFVSTNEFLQTRTKQLFVRDCYPELYEESLRQFELSLQAVFIVGTPGIGKSCFLDYLLVKFVSQSLNVLYLFGPFDKAYLFSSQDGSVRKADLVAGLKDLKPSEFDIVLFDPHETADATNVVHINHLRGKRVYVAMSPDRDNCKKLRKDLADKGLKIDLYMGTQPLEEAQEMREACRPELSADTIANRYKSFGGILRHLYAPEAGKFNFCPAEVASRQAEALDDLVEKARRIDATTVPSKYKSLWSLYHLQPMSSNGKTIWDECTVEICCDDWKTRIRDKLLEREVKDLWYIYSSTKETEGTLRGIRYEAYAHKKIMQSGLSGIAQCLIQSGIGKRTIEVDIPPGLEQVNVPNNDVGQSLAELINHYTDTDTNVYLLPHLSNFPVVDSMAIGGKVDKKKAVANLQMKAGRSDDLSDEAANVMKTTEQDILIFIVPDETVMSKKLKGSPKTKNMIQCRMIVSEKKKANTKKRKIVSEKKKANTKKGKAEGTMMIMMIMTTTATTTTRIS